MMEKNPNEWEQHYLDQNIPWDKGRPAPALVAFLKDHPAPTGRILVPGCGMGHDVRALSAAGGEASEVIGFDLSPTAMKLADDFPKVGREHFLAGDYFKLPEELHHSFDWIWEHTCFCAIDQDQRASYVQASAKALKPGGKLLGVFYLNPYDDEHAPGEGPPHGCSLDELEKLFGDLFEITEHWQPSDAYPGREGKELMVILQKR
ncbi:MAG: TPMT family class I SAM-dependent methyltransferase [Verrucomicrobiales bacterium]|nr:TPMT family class I SAM-dependent methyltransferase [Verrucomicrobiales bacterium]